METTRKILAPVITATHIIWIALFIEKIGLAIGLWDGALLHPFWGRLLLAFGMPDDSYLGYLLVRYASFVALGSGMVLSGIHWFLGVLINIKKEGAARRDEAGG